MNELDQPPPADDGPTAWVDMANRLRRAGLLIGAVLVLLLILFASGQLTGLVAFLTALVFVAIAALLPTDAETGGRHANAGVSAHSASTDQDDEQAISLMQAMPDPVVVIDANATVIFVNRHAERLLGQNMVGTSAFIRFRDPDVLAVMRRALASGSRQEVDYNARKELDSWYRLTVVPIDTKQASGFFLLHLRDISEAHRLEKMRSDFVGNASHELRTPLASLKGFLETLAGPAKNDEAARDRFIPIMQEQAERMERLIDDLLSLSRFETGVGQGAFEPVDMADVLFHVRTALTPLAETVGATIELDDEALLAHPLRVQGNRDELIQVYENLVENSVKYGGEGTQVNIRAMHDTEQNRSVLRVEASDNGPGIASEHIPRLTERFYRVDVQSSRNKQGTGLGLAIVKHILSRHDGRLSVRSEVGKGSVFVTVLPLLAE